MINRLKTFNDIDKGKFRVNLSPQFTALIFRAADYVFQGRLKDHRAFQCSCGSIFVVPVRSMQCIPKDKKNNLLCSMCGNYSFQIIKGFYIDLKGTRDAKEQIETLYNQAQEQNYLTLALYGRASVEKFNKEILSIRKSVDMFKEQIYLMETVRYLQYIGIFSSSNPYRDLDRTEVGMKLLQYCHLIELATVYHMLHDLILVAFNKIRITNIKGDSPSELLRYMSLTDIIRDRTLQIDHIFYDENYFIPLQQPEKYTFKVHGEGKQLPFKDSPGRTFDSVKILTQLCDKYCTGLADHIRFFYDNQLRNAFAHSQYDIRDGKIYLVKYGREIEKQHFEKMLERCQVIFEFFVSKLFQLNERTLTAYGGGSGISQFIKPILYTVNDNFDQQ